FWGVSPIVPPNFAGGAGIWSPWIVVVALGEPGVPVTCWAAAGAARLRVIASAASIARSPIAFIVIPRSPPMLDSRNGYHAVVHAVRAERRLEPRVAAEVVGPSHTSLKAPRSVAWVRVWENTGARPRQPLVRGRLGISTGRFHPGG